RADVEEVDVHAVDLGNELRQRVQARLDPPEVVLVQPVTGERLQGLELDPLRPVGDELCARPTRRGDATPQALDGVRRKLDPERADVGCRLNAWAHDDLQCLGGVEARVPRRSAWPVGQVTMMPWTVSLFGHPIRAAGAVLTRTHCGPRRVVSALA